ncbi:MAG: hypothetical protein JRI23_19030, partial [Deltaproteobacteria bacterium]|nr:hypothetical protein [Deltaproteobacteria bacterium]MBW2533959.1 hypothetical protein [Deltaproteobacteria bacterium]
AIRVAVTPGANSGELRAVVLAAGQSLPAGSHEAVLVALDPSVNLIAPRS